MISPVVVLGDLLARTVRGGVTRRLRRLKQPRYLLSTAVAILYFAMIIGRPLARMNAPHGAGRRPPLPSGELPAGVLLVAAFALTALALLAWMWKPARAALPLTEAEAQFLFPAPLTRRAVLRYALLRGQLAILLGAALLALIRSGGGGGPRTFVGAWTMLALFNLHAQGIGFTKASWNERRPAWRAAAALGVLVVPALLLALAFAGLLAGLSLTWVPELVARAGQGILFPAQLLLKPLLRVASPPSFAALLPGVALVVLHFLWVDGSAARFEEATLAHAARRAEQRALRSASGAPWRPAPNRTASPFALRPTGLPEAAILWKNILAVRRTPFARQALVLALVLALFAAAAAGVVWRDPARLLVVQSAVLACLAGGVLLALLSSFTQREDFRSDLVYADVLRTWPLRPWRIAAGELAAPLLTASVRLGVGLLAGLALALGARAGLRATGTYIGFPAAPWLDVFTRPAALLPWIGAALVAVPPAVALLLVAQNAATLAFPAWFPPGTRRTGGPEVTGMAIVSFLGTAFLVLVALLPVAAVTGTVAWLGRGLGPAWLPALAPVAALPMALEAGLGLVLLGALLGRHDPALDAGP